MFNVASVPRYLVLIIWLSTVLASAGLAGQVWAGASLAPEAASPGAAVTVAGRGFGTFKSAQANRVLFNGVPALVQRWEPELIEVRVPLRARTGPVVVVRGKKKIKVGTFTVTKPVVQTVIPAEAEAGSRLQITGEHFGNTAGSKDPNSMFGVNDVLIAGVPARVRKWRDTKIEVEVPANAETGDVVVRLASYDPLPDGSCCAPVEYTVSNAALLTVMPTIKVDPLAGPVGTKVVLFGRGFGASKAPADAVLFGGRPATVAQWSDKVIVVHVPLNAASGPLTLRRGGADRVLGGFTVVVPKPTGLAPDRAPIGSLLRITGEHFGFFSESGSTPFAFIDFNTGENGVEIGGVQAIIYRWHDDRIDVWVPYSAKDGPVVIKRGATIPKTDGSCCAERGVLRVAAGAFTVAAPRVKSFSPSSAGLDEVVTITGSGFGNFLKTMEATQSGVNERAHDSQVVEANENVSRSEVLFNGIAGQVLSWTDTEIKVRVPHRHAFGFGTPKGFLSDPTTGPLVVRRGSWDLLPDGGCCTPKKWVVAEAGQFTILPTGLPDQGYFNDKQPGGD